MAQPESTSRSARERQKGRKVTTIVIAIPVVLILMPTCILLSVLMLPTMVAFVIDGSPGRKFVVTVGMMNLAGAMPGIAELWMDGHSFQAAFSTMADPFMWAFALMAAGLGWMIYWITPFIVANYQGISTRAQVLDLKMQQKKLVVDWGEEVAVAGPRLDENADGDAAETEVFGGEGYEVTEPAA